MAGPSCANFRLPCYYLSIALAIVTLALSLSTLGLFTYFTAELASILTIVQGALAVHQTRKHQASEVLSPEDRLNTHAPNAKPYVAAGTSFAALTIVLLILAFWLLPVALNIMWIFKLGEALGSGPELRDSRILLGLVGAELGCIGLQVVTLFVIFLNGYGMQKSRDGVRDDVRRNTINE
ncbi:hypothetical protein FA15DRAFT_706494 [Coprinopsis marcescibilis]|uniref:Uncharacterized protein n=1 Tax=Coprinopsis marcescibilis TaxID=230819 RepID=A0A5C3KPA1_COPMA|nr:hypothetical protein FA15DRAFT_706494 [Coprinopsis marcescibilis]